MESVIDLLRSLPDLNKGLILGYLLCGLVSLFISRE